ncbi:MAG: Na+/H+ antiporter, partial [Solirubrobacterales bacterium]|nr:Na+/H+ antiporter [Solirubrobacterales bacterium]
LEGESLINDGTALVVYHAAVAVALGGSFSLLHASGDFVLDVAGGVLVGVIGARLLGVVMERIQDDVLGVTVSLLCGYAAYLPAEELGVSGVIASVTLGLTLGRQGHRISSAASRLRGDAFWEVLVFLLNAALFVLVGLQFPGVLEAQDRSAVALLALGLLTGATVIGTRLVWLNTAPYLVRALDRRPQQRARRIGWRGRLITGWSGLRGAVSLAAALALPGDFPERDLIVFLTLCVIFATLVLQGLTLPLIIRFAAPEDDGAGAREELVARKHAARVAIERIEALRAEDWTRTDSVERLSRIYEFRMRRVLQQAGHGEEDDEDLDERSHAWQRMVRDVLDHQRAELVRLRDEGTIADEVLHHVVRELDLEDERLEI